jgi:hypothetical protein
LRGGFAFFSSLLLSLLKKLAVIHALAILPAGTSKRNGPLVLCFAGGNA